MNAAAKRRRRRTIRIGALLGAVVIGNGPILASYATTKYQNWKEHQPSYQRQYGEWDVVGDSKTRSIHAAMLDSGKVLLMAGSGNDQTSFNDKNFRSVLWDPLKNTFTKIYTPWDVFCAGHAFLANGDLLIAGGTKKYEILAQNSPTGKTQQYEGLKDSFTFSPVTNSFTRVGYLNHARWYPSLTRVADGSVVVVSGLDETGNIDQGNTESYTPAQQLWIDHPSLHKIYPTYPALFLAQDGRLFFSGANAGYGPAAASQRKPGLWNLQTNAFQVVPGLPDPDANETAATVLLPPAQDQKFMFIGGGTAGDTQIASARTAIVDLNAPNPTYKAAASMSVAKRYPGAVVLPDDTVLVSGGSRNYRAKDSKTAEIYHPATDTFTAAAPPHVGRDYHSEYLLLPDGRVAVFGSNPLSDNNSFETRVEVYSPPYLFKGPRPTIVAAPKTIELGKTALFTVSGGAAKVRLIAPGSYTHVTDTDQRSVALPITNQSGTTITVSIPASPNLTPPGQYMVFVDNAAGIPSVAAWINVVK